MELIFLGTSCMVPTKERSHQSLLLRYRQEGILFDCGEGAQRQLKIAGIPPTKITKIVISHWHGDHVLGLPGLLQTLAASKYDKELLIFGPAGTKENIKKMLDVFVFDNTLSLKIKDISAGAFFDCDSFVLEAQELDHTIQTYGFRFVEKDRRRINLGKVKKMGLPVGPLLGQLASGKSVMFKGVKITPDETTYVVKGKKVAVISDTAVCENCYNLAKNVDLLVCEAAYTSQLEEKAEEYKHMTARQAALLASKSNVERLVLTHISARYKTGEEIEEDAKTAFPNSMCAYDFMKVRV